MRRTLLSILAVGCMTLWLVGRTPGGVGGAEAWFQCAPVSGGSSVKYRWVDFAGDSLAMSPDNEYCLLNDNSSGIHYTDKSKKVKFVNLHPAARVASFNNSQ